MRLPHGDVAIVPRDKVLEYLLAPEHPEGGSKAPFFLAMGYDPARPGVLIAALKDVASNAPVVETIRTEHGTKHIVDGDVETPSGRNVRLRTVWIVPIDSARPQFVTAYPI